MPKIKKNIKLFTGFVKSALPYVFFFSLFVFGLQAASAQSVFGDWDKYLKDVPGFSANNETGEDLAINFILNLVQIVRNLVGVAALLIGVIYGLRLVMARGQEETISKQKTNFLWLIVGFVILIISENVARIFNPEDATSGALIDFDATRDQLRDIVNYVKWLIGSIIALYMTTVAYRMITAGDDEEEINTQKKSLTWGLFGMLTILLASNIVNAIYVLNAPDEAAAAAPASAISEIVGVLRLILVFLGPVAIIFTVYAGFLYLTAMEDDEQTTTAKRMIIAGIVAIIIIYGAYALVNTFTSQDLSFLSPYLV